MIARFMGDSFRVDLPAINAARFRIVLVRGG
jgi:hypothetical protein